jgi:hypothetical protein
MVEPEQFPSFVLFSGSGIGREWVTVRADGSHRGCHWNIHLTTLADIQAPHLTAATEPSESGDAWQA